MNRHIRPDPAAATAARPLHLDAPVPLLTAEQYRVLAAVMLSPQLLTDFEFGDSLHLIRSGLTVLDRRTDLLTITDDGRRYLVAGP